MTDPYWAELVIVDRAHAETRARLANDPKLAELSAASIEEAATTPDVYFHRNMEALYIETNTPMTAYRHRFLPFSDTPPDPTTTSVT